MRKYALLVVIAFLGKAGNAADFACAGGDVSCLVAAINAANANGADNVINLGSGTFTLHVVDNLIDGANGLPSIIGRMTIRGPANVGSNIQRDPAAPSFRIFHVASGGNLRLDWLGITQGRASTDTPNGGGAMLNRGTLVLNRAMIYGNQADRGGGGAILSFGTLIVSNSSINHNSAGQDHGGGVTSTGSFMMEDSFVFNNAADLVSALALSGFAVIKGTSVYSNNSTGNAAVGNTGTLLIEGSDVRDNTVSIGGSNAAGVANSGSLSIVSSTIARNQSGGILNSGNLTLRSVTVAGNTAASTGGIIPTGISNSGTARFRNTIVALNTDHNAAPSDCNSFTSLGNNVIGSLTGCTVQLQTTDRVGDPRFGTFAADPMLAGSGNFPLLLMSPAVNGGSDGGCSPRDQLGNTRLGVCDIGAVEFRVLAAR